jgi:archaeosine synthase beta-subunit
MKPAYLRISPVNINGSQSKRLMAVLKTKGCEYARNNGGGCTVCGFINHADPHITDEEIVRQLDYCLENLDLQGVEEIDLLTLGSFYNDNEVNPATRERLLNKISGLSAIKRISIESRAEYITTEKLKRHKTILGERIVELGIGLESADDYIRNQVIKKALSKKSFEKVVGKIREAENSLLVYLLIKPPRLTEQQAIRDAVSSAQYVFETAEQYGVPARVAFEPVFITEHTYLEKLFLNSQYRLVNLWSVVEILRQVRELGSVFVGLSDENLSLERMPGSCPECTARLVRGIEAFNRTQDLSFLTGLHCECKESYEYRVREGLI